MWPYQFCFPPPSHKYTHLWQPPLNESTDQTNFLPISLSIMVPELFTCDMHSKIASQTSLLLLGANDSPWFSLFRSVIHAAHREGERDTTDWREWYLFFFFFFSNNISYEFSHLCFFSLLHSCRLYYRPSCHLWWPVTASSTLPGSSKTWTPPQSWKTSRSSGGTQQLGPLIVGLLLSFSLGGKHAPPHCCC